MVIGIEIIDELSYQVEEGEFSSEPYSDRAATYTSHDIRGFEIVSKKEKYFDLKLDFEPKKDTPYYLLYAIYSTGDSFGQDYGKWIEYYDLYTKDQMEIAKENKNRLYNEKEKYDVILKGKDGKDIKSYIPWNGYFESLDELEIKKIYRKN